MSKRWIIIGILLLVLWWAISNAAKGVVTAVAAVSSIATITVPWLWPVAIVSWLTHLLWGSDWLRNLFGMDPLKTFSMSSKANQ